MEEVPEGEEDLDQFELPTEERGPELLQACKDNNTVVAKELIKLGVPVLNTIEKGGWTTLHFASLHGNEEVVQALLTAGAAERYKQLRAKTINTSNNNQESNLFLSNTPLQWAAYHGHINVCWFLLDASYDPDDADNLGNTPLHLAATNNHEAIVRLLLRSGANPSLPNIFGHIPMDLSTNNKTREVLRKAVSSSSTSLSSSSHHSNNNVIKEAMKQANLQVFKAAQEKVEQALNGGGGGGGERSSTTLAEGIDALEKAILHGDEVKISTDLLKRGKKTLKEWKAAHQLVAQMEKIDVAAPIITQRQYCDLVNKLEGLSLRAKAEGVEEAFLEKTTSVINRSHAEYWLHKAQAPLLHVTRVDASHQKDMIKLEDHIKAAQAVNAHQELLSTAVLLLNKLTCEVDLRNCLIDFPETRVPIAESPKDYWQPEDTGRLQETEGFPQPLPDGNYQWIHSDAYSRFKLAQAALRYAIEEAEKYGCNAELIAEAKVKGKTTDPIALALEGKDEADKQLAIAALQRISKRRSSKESNATGKVGKKGGGKKVIELVKG